MIKLKCRDDFNAVIAKSGFTKRGLARKCGLSESTLIQISNGKQSPRADTAKKICSALQVNFDDIFMIEKKHDG